jgi:hypothetical protein
VTPRSAKSTRGTVSGFERVPGPGRHYRDVATGEELSRRQYQQRARGYFYERRAKGRARAGARRKYLTNWADYLKRTVESFVDQTRNAILRELRRLGLSPPHHGSKRRPSLAEAAKQEAFMEFIGRDVASTRQYYPTLVEETGESAARSAEY